jgi:hypothetical protein
MVRSPGDPHAVEWIAVTTLHRAQPHPKTKNAAECESGGVWNGTNRRFRLSESRLARRPRPSPT